MWAYTSRLELIAELNLLLQINFYEAKCIFSSFRFRAECEQTNLSSDIKQIISISVPIGLSDLCRKEE